MGAGEWVTVFKQQPLRRPWARRCALSCLGGLYLMACCCEVWMNISVMLNQQQKSDRTVRSSTKTSEEAKKKRKQEPAEEMLYQDLILNSVCLSDAQITSLSWKDSESISTNINGLYSSAILSRRRYAEMEPQTTIKCARNNPAGP